MGHYDAAHEADRRRKEHLKKDNINPSHYKQGKVEAIDAIEAATVSKTGIEAVCVAQILKYVWGYENKNGVEDCRKALWYLTRLIETLDSKEENKPQQG